MRPCLLLLAVAAGAAAQPAAKLPELVDLKQHDPRPHPKLKLPKHEVGPTIHGLTPGATDLSAECHCSAAPVPVSSSIR